MSVPQRWCEVHAQVEAIVGSAMKRGRRDRRLRARRAVTRVAGLTGSQIETLAARRERRISADQSERSLDPDNIAAMPALGPDDPALTRQQRINGEYCEHHREAEIAKVLTKDFDFGELNRPLVMSTTRGLLDEGEALKEGEVGILLPDEVTCILRDSGVDLPGGHRDRPLIAAAASAAMQRGHEAALRQMGIGVAWRYIAPGKPVQKPSSKAWTAASATNA